jgi:hypothetical protein
VKTKLGIPVLFAVCIALTACSITQTVEPIRSAQVSRVCVLNNTDVLMDDFQPEMQKQIELKGIPTQVYTGNRPSECSHHLEYSANWQWDMAVYLVYADLRIYDAQGLAGHAMYNARSGGGRLDKFGRTAEKLRPLIDELFGSVPVGAALAPLANGSDVAAATQRTESSQRLKELQRLRDEGLITDEEYSSKRQDVLSEI